jgi:hypothetical protein
MAMTVSGDEQEMPEAVFAGARQSDKRLERRMNESEAAESSGLRKGGSPKLKRAHGHRHTTSAAEAFDTAASAHGEQCEAEHDR